MIQFKRENRLKHYTSSQSGYCSASEHQNIYLAMGIIFSSCCHSDVGFRKEEPEFEQDDVDGYPMKFVTGNVSLGNYSK